MNASMVQVLDPSGRTAGKVLLAREELLRLYRWMVVGRVLTTPHATDNSI